MKILIPALAALSAATSAVSAQSSLFVTTTDYQSGSAAFLAPGATEAEVNLLNQTHAAEVKQRWEAWHVP